MVRRPSARNHRLPIRIGPSKGEWRKEKTHVLAWHGAWPGDDAYRGVYFISQEHEGKGRQAFAVQRPPHKYATKGSKPDPARQSQGRFTHYYFYLRDETLGARWLMRVACFPFQTTYYSPRPKLSYRGQELKGGAQIRRSSQTGPRLPEATTPVTALRPPPTN